MNKKTYHGPEPMKCLAGILLNTLSVAQKLDPSLNIELLQAAVQFLWINLAKL